MASLKSKIQRAVDRQFTRLDSFRVAANYVSVGQVGLLDYDPTAGVPTETTEKTAIRVILTTPTQTEIDHKNLKIQDKKAVFSRTGFTFNPDAEDKIEILEGPDEGTWEVVQVLSEPSASALVIAIRRP